MDRVKLIANGAEPLQRCAHSIYLAREDERRLGKAFYCATCRPEGFGKPYHYGVGDGTVKNLLMAERYMGSPRQTRVTANTSESRSNFCPKCQSAYRYKIEKSPEVECAECGTPWKPIRRSDSDVAEAAAHV